NYMKRILTITTCVCVWSKYEKAFHAAAFQAQLLFDILILSTLLLWEVTVSQCLLYRVINCRRFKLPIVCMNPGFLYVMVLPTLLRKISIMLNELVSMLDKLVSMLGEVVAASMLYLAFYMLGVAYLAVGVLEEDYRWSVPDLNHP
ncbi:hypothetical protein QYM36_007620, partial [Artemia franciscana]